MRLCPSKSVKYLGIYLDEHLNGSAHIEVLIPKLRRANGMLAKIRHYTSTDQTKTIYHAIFGSHMTYGCQIWGQSFTDTYMNKIQVLQNNALRLISFADSFRDHVSPIYQNYNLLKIKDLISLKNMLLIHDYFKNKLPNSFNGYFTIKVNAEPNEGSLRNIIPPARYNEYELTEPDMRPQIHSDAYRYRNINLQGELDVPDFN